MSVAVACLISGIIALFFAGVWATIGQASRNMNGSKAFQTFCTIVAVLFSLASFGLLIGWIMNLVVG